MSDEAAEYWSAFEKETGEKVEARGMGEWLRGESRESGLWGLLILTDKSFRYKHTPSDNWLSSLFRRAARSSEQAKPVEIVIPRTDIISLNAPTRGLLTRLFGPAFPIFSITYRDADEKKSLRFTVDPGSGLLPALVKSSPASAGDGRG